MANLNGITVMSQGEINKMPLNGIIYRDPNGQITNFQKKKYYAFVRSEKRLEANYDTSDLSIDMRYVYTVDTNNNLNKILIGDGSIIWKVSLPGGSTNTTVTVAKKGNDEIVIVGYYASDYYTKTYSSDGNALDYSRSSGFALNCFGNRESDCFYIIEVESSSSYGNNISCISTQTLKGVSTMDVNLISQRYPTLQYFPSMNATVVTAGYPSSYVSLYDGDMNGSIKLLGSSTYTPSSSINPGILKYDSIACSNANPNMFYVYMSDGSYENGILILMDRTCKMVTSWQMPQFGITKFELSKMFMIDDILFLMSNNSLISFRETKTDTSVSIQELNITDLNVFSGNDSNHLNLFKENGQVKMIQNGNIFDFI